MNRLRIPVKALYPWFHATEWARNRVQTSDERRTLLQVRGERDVCWDREEEEPLVTVRVATYNRGSIVAERALASAVNQTYRNLEILVVGDSCDAATEAAVRSIDDPRLRFVNLARRGVYPDRPHHRRKVAGAHPMNVATALARGSWIAPLDDDDEFTPDHVEVLLDKALSERFEMVYSRAEMEREPGVWETIGSSPLRQGEIGHGTVIYSSALGFMPYSMTCWKRRQPADWNMWDRMRRVGVKIGFLDRVTFRHYLSDAARTRLARTEESPDAGTPPV